MPLSLGRIMNLLNITYRIKKRPGYALYYVAGPTKASATEALTMATKNNTHNSPNGQDNRLYLLQRGQRIPVKFDIFKHGGGVYLALVNPEKGIHIPLMANASTMRLELQGALYRIDVAMATNDQGHISREAAMVASEVVK